MTVYEKAVRFLTPYLEKKQANNHAAPPLVVGVEGPQGSGKTTVSRQLTTELSHQYPSLNFLTFSMDDFYLTYDEQNAVSQRNLGNIMLCGRGLPGTHDLSLLLKCFKQLIARKDSIDIPQYDKSLHSGSGDRLPFDKWIHLHHQPVDVIIFEGWFNGYPSYSDLKALLSKWESVQKKYTPAFDSITTSQILKLNSDLAKYQQVWNLFDVFVCLTTNSISNVYRWRLQQEHDMIKSKGSGMSDSEVTVFVDRYMPVYRLYYDRLDETLQKTPTVNICIDIDRRVLSTSLPCHI